jgi:hypothetical protein
MQDTRRRMFDSSSVALQTSEIPRPYRRARNETLR